MAEMGALYPSDPEARMTTTSTRVSHEVQPRTLSIIVWMAGNTSV
jgi:hypothetical protein